MVHRTPARRLLRVVALTLVLCGGLGLSSGMLGAAQPPVETTSPFPPAAAEVPFTFSGALSEIRVVLVRLPFAAVLGALLALRPRRQGQGPRSVLVVQTQIMLAVVGAVVMLVVGNSLSRAFGIVGAAGLVRYRSNITDPKDAVVMLCALASGLAVGVGLYVLAPFATLFMVALLWLVEYFEPPARKHFELKVTVAKAPDFRSTIEDVFRNFKLEFELLLESQDELRYLVSAPIDVRMRDISDILRIVRGEELTIRWDEKKSKR